MGVSRAAIGGVPVSLCSFTACTFYTLDLSVSGVLFITSKLVCSKSNLKEPWGSLRVFHVGRAPPYLKLRESVTQAEHQGPGPRAH